MCGAASESGNATTSAVAIVVCVALLAASAIEHLGVAAERSVVGASQSGAPMLTSSTLGAHDDFVKPQGPVAGLPSPVNPILGKHFANATIDVEGLAPRPSQASRFTGLWEVSAIAIREELSGLVHFALQLGKTLGLAVVGKGADGAVGQLVKGVLVGILSLPKLLFDRAATLVVPSSTLEERVDAATRLAVDIGLTLVGVRGVKLARVQASKFIYRGWSNERIIAAIAKPRPKGLRRDFFNEMRVQRLQFVLADRIKSRIHVQDVRVARKYPWLTRKQYFQANDVATQLARTAVRKGDDFFDNAHILRLSQGWDMHMSPAGSMLRPTGTVTLRKPPPRFILPVTVPQFRVFSELVQIAPMANWVLGKVSQTAAAKSIGRTVFGNRLLAKVRDWYRRGVQDLDYRIVRSRSASGPNATLAAQSRALSQTGRVDIDAGLRNRLGQSEAVDAMLFEATRHPQLAAALKQGAPVRIRAFDAKYPAGRIRIKEGRVEVSPGRRAFRLEDDLDLERAVFSVD